MPDTPPDGRETNTKSIAVDKEINVNNAVLPWDRRENTRCVFNKAPIIRESRVVIALETRGPKLVDNLSIGVSCQVTRLTSKVKRCY